ncbi:MAG: single-stranded DNA-binding protein [Fusobacterium mortiferum]|uniref:single-stranded DNA-binding protein n=1 Tax=Fusobacterium TaxID=848 RepID=UPI001F27F72C|nr:MULTISPECIES: single-stranded DNA-binding protein [Fusobacterium]MCF2699361.1 single-stranded DNA-binding protein [Fusobacterium mortiferum]MDY4800971.1 single-stranded DNA-binding protein [Fusobacterium mortiferum]
MKLDVNELLEIAKKEVENLKTDEIFLVKELFKGYEWNRIDRKTRLLLGILFLNWVRTTNEDKIKIIEKTSSGQQKYKII